MTVCVGCEFVKERRAVAVVGVEHIEVPVFVGLKCRHFGMVSFFVNGVERLAAISGLCKTPVLGSIADMGVSHEVAVLIRDHLLVVTLKGAVPGGAFHRIDLGKGNSPERKCRKRKRKGECSRYNPTPDICLH